jgi:hypothetical protein
MMRKTGCVVEDQLLRARAANFASSARAIDAGVTPVDASTSVV